MKIWRTLSVIVVGQLMLLAASFSQASEASVSFARGNFDLANYTGKVVYLDFWASWCGPCRASFPFMNDLVETYGDDLAVVTINVDEDAASALAFMAEFAPNFSVFHDPAGTLAKRYQVSGMPNSFVFDREGKLLLKHIGFTKSTAAELGEELRQALAK